MQALRSLVYTLLFIAVTAVFGVIVLISAVLRPAVDAFFDSVMVMAEDPALRANRLALLGRLRGLFMHAADLSRLPG